MYLTNENVKQNNVYFERVCKLHCAVHCAMVEGAGRGLWAYEGLRGGDTWVRDEHMLLGDVRKKEVF